MKVMSELEDLFHRHLIDFCIHMVYSIPSQSQSVVCTSIRISFYILLSFYQENRINPCIYLFTGSNFCGIWYQLQVFFLLFDIRHNVVKFNCQIEWIKFASFTLKISSANSRYLLKFFTIFFQKPLMIYHTVD